MKTLTRAIAALAFLSPVGALAQIDCSNGSNCDPTGSATGVYVSPVTNNSLDLSNRSAVIADLRANGFSEAEARATADAYARQSQRQTATGGAGGAAAGGSATATGEQRARTGDVSVSYSEENPTNAAYAPSIGAGSNYQCDRFFGVSFGGNGDTRSISGGIGIPYEAETCAIAYAAETVAALTGNEAAVNAILATMDRVRDAGVTYDPATGRLIVAGE